MRCVRLRPAIRARGDTTAAAPFPVAAVVVLPGGDTAVPRMRGALMASRRRNIVVVMLHLADDLERRHYPMAGVLRQLAREVAQLGFDDPDDAGRCGCGQSIVQPRTGRPRRYCFSCSPPRKTPGKRDDYPNITVNNEGNAA